ncbi:MAG: hypothetical protein ACRDJG_12555 [Actinomycetota bacterium]
MRVLIVGAYPPAADRSARETLETATRLIDQGHEVQVLSPQPTAAGDDAVLIGLRGALTLARRSRRFDALHVQVDCGLLIHPATPRLRRILIGLGLAGALRLWRETTADLGELADLPGGPGGRVSKLIWGSFDRLIVDNEPAGDHLRVMMGIPAGRIEVAGVESDSEAPASGAPREATIGTGSTGEQARPPGEALPGWSLGEAPDAASIMAQVRARAAIERAGKSLRSRS